MPEIILYACKLSWPTLATKEIKGKMKYANISGYKKKL